MDESTHHVRVTLLRVAPKVTRSLLVPSDLRLDRLHQVLQIAMGWDDSHLHEFIVGTLRDGERYGPAAPKSPFGFEAQATRPESRYTLRQIAPATGSKFLYWYDFGDDWHHEIVVKSIAAASPGGDDLRCLEGEGACPPEDCGGPHGYALLLEALSDPKHASHEEMLEWVGDDFDPSRFSVDVVNEELEILEKRWKPRPRKATAKRGAS